MEFIGIVFACILLRLAYKFFDKGKITQSVFALWASVFILLCSFSWFQGWAKSFIASNLISRLTAIGEQVNTVQTTTTEMLNQYSNQVNILKQTNEVMHNLLADHQIQINKQQKELDEVQVKIRGSESNILNQQSDITNQFRQISGVQSGLEIARTNLDSETKKLSDIEYWVQNLYDQTVNEKFSLADTNRYVLFISTNSSQIFCAFRLSHAPIKGSVEAFSRFENSLGESRANMGSFFKNVTTFSLQDFQTNGLEISFHYVADTRVTNLVQNIQFLDSHYLLLDGFPVQFH